MRCGCLNKKGLRKGGCLKVFVSIYNYLVESSISKGCQWFYEILNNAYTTFAIQSGLRVSYEISCSPQLSPYLTVTYASSDDELAWNAASIRDNVTIAVTSNTEWEINTT